MEDKGSPEITISNLKPRMEEFSSRIFSMIKLILGVCLLPFVYSSSVAFLKEIGLIETAMQNYFWWGMAAFLIVYLFVWEPLIIYANGQRIVELIFIFFKPLVKVAPYLLPIYTIVLFIVYKLVSQALKLGWLINYLIVFLGFSLALHIVFSAKSLRSKQSDFLKANYIFGYSFIYIINVVIISAILNVLFEQFSFINFCSTSFHAGKDIFESIFRQLFLYKSN